MMKSVSNYPISKPVSRLIKTCVLTYEEMAAAIDIECAVISILENDIRSSRQEEASCSPSRRRFQAVRLTYYDWIDAMQAAGLSSGPIFDVVMEGRALHLVDKAWRRRKGWTRVMLIKGLRLYCAVKQNRAAQQIRLTA